MLDKYSSKQVGQRIKEFRYQTKKSQKKFAESLGWSVDLYRKIETGRVMITSEKLQQLYIQYHVDICYILTGVHTDSTEITEDSLLNLHLRVNDEQWLNMEIRMLQYYKDLGKDNL